MAKQTLFNKIKSMVAKAKNKNTPQTESQQVIDARKEWLIRQQLLKQQQYQNISKKNIPQSNNKFSLMLQRRRAVYDRFEANRKRNELPKGYVAEVDRLRQLENKRKSDFGKSNSLLRAHENMNKVTMDFSDTKGNILTAPNVFSNQDPNNNIFRPTGRPNILQTQDSILKAKHRLRF